MASNGTPSSALFCASCGAQLGGPFCSACGSSAIGRLNGSHSASPDAGTATMVADAPTQTIPLQMPLLNGHAPSAADKQPSARRPRGLIISAGCAALALVAAAIFAVVFLTGGDDSASRSQTSLRDAARGAQPALSGATGASHLVDVQSVARLAGGQQERMATLLGTASTIADHRYLRSTSAMLRAERALLRDLAGLSTVSETNLDAWSSIKQSLQRDSLALSEARPAVVGLHLHTTLPLTLTAGTANRAIATLDRVIGHADQALTTWRAQTRAAHARNHRAMAVTVSYANTMRGYLSRYDSLRGDMSDWVAKVDAEGATFDEAYQFLGDATTGRQNLKDSMDHLQAPTAALASAQSRVEQVLSDSIQAMNDAQSGISDYQFSDLYTNYKDTPGWQQFSSSSSKISDDLTAAQNDLEAQIAARQKAVRNHGLPPKPAV
jgi:hypothetical protein